MAAPLLVVVPDWEVVDTLGKGFGKQHARYRLVCSEAGCSWEVARRWTELRMTIEALKATHAAAFDAPAIPAFEPHAWWRLGAAALEPSFLQERAASMQALLQGLVDVLGVSVVRQRGPSPLLALLSDCDDASSLRSPAAAPAAQLRQSNGVLSPPPAAARAPGTPADWRMAQSAAAQTLDSPADAEALGELAAAAEGGIAVQSPLANAGSLRYDTPKGGGARGSGEPTEGPEPTWLTEAGLQLRQTATGNVALPTPKVARGPGADTLGFVSPTASETTMQSTPDTLEAPSPPAIDDVDIHHVSEELANAGTDAPQAQAVPAPVPDESAPIDEMPTEPPAAAPSAEAPSAAAPSAASAAADAWAAAAAEAAVAAAARAAARAAEQGKATVEMVAEAAAPSARPHRRPTPPLRKPRSRAAAKASGQAQANGRCATRGAASSALDRQAARYADGETADNELRAELRARRARGGAAEGGKRIGRWPVWAVLLVLVLVCIRGAYLLTHLSPSYVQGRIDRERERNSPDRPIQGPHGLMYPVASKQRPAATTTAPSVDEAPRKSSAVPVPAAHRAAAAAVATAPAPAAKADVLAHAVPQATAPTPSPAPVATKPVVPVAQLASVDRHRLESRPRTSGLAELEAAAELAAPPAVRAAREAFVEEMAAATAAKEAAVLEAARGASKGGGASRAKAKRTLKLQAEYDRAAGVLATKEAALASESHALEASRIAANGQVEATRAEADEALATAAAAASAASRSSFEKIASSQEEVEAAQRDVSLGRAEVAAAGVRVKEVAKASGLTDRQGKKAAVAAAKATAKEAAAAMRAAQVQARAASKRLAGARSAGARGTKQVAKATAELRRSHAKTIAKVAKAGTRRVQALTTKVARAQKQVTRAAAAMEKAHAKFVAVRQ